MEARGARSYLTSSVPAEPSGEQPIGIGSNRLRRYLWSAKRAHKAEWKRAQATR